MKTMEALLCYRKSTFGVVMAPFELKLPVSGRNAPINLSRPFPMRFRPIYNQNQLKIVQRPDSIDGRGPMRFHLTYDCELDFVEFGVELRRERWVRVSVCQESLSLMLWIPRLLSDFFNYRAGVINCTTAPGHPLVFQPPGIQISNPWSHLADSVWSSPGCSNEVAK